MRADKARICSGRCHSHWRSAGGGRFLHDQVGIGPAETERTDPGQAPLLSPRPGPGLDRNLHRQGAPVDMRIHRLEVQVSGNGFVLQRQHHLDQPGHAGRRFQMSQVGLDRSHHQRMLRTALRSQHRG